MQYGLIKQSPVPEWLGSPKQILAAHTHFNTLLKNIVADLGHNSLDDRPGIFGGLQESWDEYVPEARDSGGFLLHTYKWKLNLEIIILCPPPDSRASRARLINSCAVAESTPYRLQRSLTSRRLGRRAPVSARLIFVAEHSSLLPTSSTVRPRSVRNLSQPKPQLPLANSRTHIRHNIPPLLEPRSALPAGRVNGSEPRVSKSMAVGSTPTACALAKPCQRITPERLFVNSAHW